MAMSNFSKDLKKDFKKIFSMVNEKTKFDSSKDVENVFGKICVKMNAFFGSTMIRVMKKFANTNNELINFSVKFDFKVLRKGYNDYAISAKAEGSVDDEKLKIDDFIV